MRAIALGAQNCPRPVGSTPSKIKGKRTLQGLSMLGIPGYPGFVLAINPLIVAEPCESTKKPFITSNRPRSCAAAPS
eukprot:scaffold167755_cov23-Tisochrysis_lutea.AAC.1